MNYIGFDKPLYVLEVDQSGCSQAGAEAAKSVIYDAFKAAVEAGVPKAKAAIVIDEQSGAILRDAAAQGYKICSRVEKNSEDKSALDQFDFEYGNRFDDHVEAVHPAFCKVSVLYNPQADRKFNREQLFRLERLSQYVHSNRSPSRLLFELLLPAGDRELGHELRLLLIVQAMEQLQDANVEPDVWAIEGFERSEDCEKVAAAARRQTRKEVGCIVMGNWLAAAAAADFVGFAAGQSAFQGPLDEWSAKKITRSDAVAEIARRYRECVDIFEARERALAA